MGFVRGLRYRSSDFKLSFSHSPPPLRRLQQQRLQAGFFGLEARARALQTIFSPPPSLACFVLHACCNKDNNMLPDRRRRGLYLPLSVRNCPLWHSLRVDDFVTFMSGLKRCQLSENWYIFIYLRTNSPTLYISTKSRNLYIKTSLWRPQFISSLICCLNVPGNAGNKKPCYPMYFLRK